MEFRPPPRPAADKGCNTRGHDHAVIQRAPTHGRLAACSKDQASLPTTDGSCELDLQSHSAVVSRHTSCVVEKASAVELGKLSSCTRTTSNLQSDICKQETCLDQEATNVERDAANALQKQCEMSTQPSNKLLVGSLVERLLDDVSNIWADGTIIAAHSGDSYDINYTDGTSEQHVEASDLRNKRVQEHVDNRRWSPGARVERLLDDVSDIWSGAVIETVHANGTYDITYVDDRTVEKHVEGSEIRSRRQPFDPPPEVWSSTCSFLCEPNSLGALENVAKTLLSAMNSKLQEAELWWCTAFHWRNFRCSAFCRMDLSLASQGGSLAAAEAARAARDCVDCIQKAAPKSNHLSGWDGNDRNKPRRWKDRCQERHEEDQRWKCEDGNQRGRAPESPSGHRSAADQDLVQSRLRRAGPPFRVFDACVTSDNRS